jgi:hypothetical protein
MIQAKRYLSDGIHIVQQLRGLHRRHLRDPRSATDKSQGQMMDLIDELDNVLLNALYDVNVDLELMRRRRRRERESRQ